MTEPRSYVETTHQVENQARPLEPYDAYQSDAALREGCAREGEGDYLRFLDIAFGSSREVLYLTSLAIRLSYFDERDGKELLELGERVAGALASLRRSYGRR